MTSDDRNATIAYLTLWVIFLAAHFLMEVVR